MNSEPKDIKCQLRLHDRRGRDPQITEGERPCACSPRGDQVLRQEEIKTTKKKTEMSSVS